MIKPVYCTYFDHRFLPQGLALIRSMQRHASQFEIWVLALSDWAEDALRVLNLHGVRVVPLRELEEADNELLRAKSSRSQLEYYYTCGPSFLRYTRDRAPNATHVAYLDADLWFFRDPELV